jgi:phage tail-like protein
VKHREGGDPCNSRKSTGQTDFEPITLERGLTRDNVFEDWANLVWKLGAALGNQVARNEFRRDIRNELYNEAGQLVRAWNVFRCWPSEYQALPDLDSAANAVAIEHI